MNLNGRRWPVDKFRSNSPPRPRIAGHSPCPGDGSRSFRKADIRYDSVMTNLPSHWIFFVATIALSAVATGARAQQSEPRQAPPPQRQDSQPLRPSRSSLSDSVRRVQRETGGQVLGAERIQFDGRDINRVKVMDDRGRVRYMDDDPQRSRESFERRRDPSPREASGPPRPRGDNPPRR